MNVYRTLCTFNKSLSHFCDYIIGHCINYKNDIKIIIIKQFDVVLITFSTLYINECSGILLLFYKGALLSII